MENHWKLIKIIYFIECNKKKRKRKEVEVEPIKDNLVSYYVIYLLTNGYKRLHLI